MATVPGLYMASGRGSRRLYRGNDFASKGIPPKPTGSSHGLAFRGQKRVSSSTPGTPQLRLNSTHDGSYTPQSYSSTSDIQTPVTRFSTERLSICSKPVGVNSSYTKVITAARLRPILGHGQGQTKICHAQEGVGKQPNSVYVEADGYGRSFAFDHVFDTDTDQERFFEELGRPLVNSVLEGYTGCVMAYGQTGSGKTHTMGLLYSLQSNSYVGSDESLNESSRNYHTHDDGFTARALSQIFHTVSHACPGEYRVALSFIQLYCDDVLDLLSDQTYTLQIREAKKRGFYVDGLTVVPVLSYNEAVDVVNNGISRRILGATRQNDASSRSHVILQIQIERSDPVTGKVFESLLSLVDLAGSERVKKSSCSGGRLEEAKHINKSLSALGTVVANMLNPRATHIPYRSSKLTMLLQRALSGGSITALISTVNVQQDNVEETLSTLTFAQRCSRLRLRTASVDQHSNQMSSPSPSLRIATGMDLELRNKYEDLSLRLGRMEQEHAGLLQKYHQTLHDMSSPDTSIRSGTSRRTENDTDSMPGCVAAENVLKDIAIGQDGLCRNVKRNMNGTVKLGDAQNLGGLMTIGPDHAMDGTTSLTSTRHPNTQQMQSPLVAQHSSNAQADKPQGPSHILRYVYEVLRSIDNLADTSKMAALLQQEGLSFDGTHPLTPTKVPDIEEIHGNKAMLLTIRNLYEQISQKMTRTHAILRVQAVRNADLAKQLEEAQSGSRTTEVPANKR